MKLAILPTGRMSKVKTSRVGCMIWGLGIPVKKICFRGRLFQAAEAAVSVKFPFYLSSGTNKCVKLKYSSIGRVQTLLPN